MSEYERIVFVEWNHNGTVHEIVAADEESRYFDHYDVNWHNDQGYIHRSGCGPGSEIFLSGKAEGFRGKIWAAPEISFTRWIGVAGEAGETVSIARKDVGEIGYDLVEEFPGDLRHDFIESDGYCCDSCDGDWIPYDDPCVHDPDAVDAEGP